MENPAPRTRFLTLPLADVGDDAPELLRRNDFADRDLDVLRESGHAFDAKPSLPAHVKLDLT